MHVHAPVKLTSGGDNFVLPGPLTLRGGGTRAVTHSQQRNADNSEQGFCQQPWVVQNLRLPEGLEKRLVADLT